MHPHSLRVLAQKADEFRQLSLAEVPEQIFRSTLDDGVHPEQQLQPRPGDLCPHNAPVLPVALLADQLECLEPRQKPGDVRVGGDHPAPDLSAGEALWMRAAQNPQHVVLGGGHSPVTALLLEGALKAIGRPQHVEERLFFHAGEGTLLRNFMLQAAPFACLRYDAMCSGNDSGRTAFIPFRAILLLDDVQIDVELDIVADNARRIIGSDAKGNAADGRRGREPLMLFMIHA